MRRAGARALWVVLAAVLAPCMSAAAARPWTAVPPSGWKGTTSARVAGLEGARSAAVAHPRAQTSVLKCTTPSSLPPGLYEVRLSLRPSHVADAVAFNSGLRVAVDGERRVEYGGTSFALVNRPEERTLRFVHARRGPIRIELTAFTDADAFEKAGAARLISTGGPDMSSRISDDADEPDGEDLGLGLDVDLDLEVALSPEKNVYYAVDSLALRALSRSASVSDLTVDKVRYAPGDTLRGSLVLRDVGTRGGSGTLRLYLEHYVDERTEVKSQPVTLRARPQTIEFEITLPVKELGYALVAEYVSADGSDRAEAAEYFTIAKSYLRVAVSGSFAAHRGGYKSEDVLRRDVEKIASRYANMCESFAWAEDDMVEMSPEADFWFSGQTCYLESRETMQTLHRLAHEKGIAVVTYGKFVMSSFFGWKTAYDYPNDHRGQYRYPVGMWEGVDCRALDRFRNKEFVVYGHKPAVRGNAFDPWWAVFLPINPDQTPRMVRIAAEELVRSIELFAWDGVRWDGHPRGGGQCGGPHGKYDLVASRRTQALVRYFKDIVSARFPECGHGYNYLMIQNENHSHDWAYEDYELDELCRGGGLLMNESIGNATEGPFRSILRNLQTDGDLCRERGGYYLGIQGVGGDRGPRDALVETALWCAAGARTYGVKSRAEGRYYTRYAQYTLDERLRRLARPEGIISPASKTRLQWRPFVYETPLERGRRQLVVNFLNVPLDEHRTPEGGPTSYVMPGGTAPVSFTLSLPRGMRATSAHLIDPLTLEVRDAPLREGRLDVPAVSVWLVGVIDLEVDPGAPSLASRFGPPKTFGVPRKDYDGPNATDLVLATTKQVWEVNKDMSALAPDWVKRELRDDAAFDELGPAQKKARLRKTRAGNTAQKFLNEWWKGGSLPADMKLRDAPKAFGDLSPHRNARFDIHYARGAMDYRMRMPVVFAGLDRFGFHDAPLGGVLRQGPDMWLAGGVPWRRYPEFDLLLFTSVPHCAIGAENSYAMVEYVKAGGAALFTGGEYAFGKGGYMHTVLERELLPVLCTEPVDTRYSETPLPFEKGRDFAELGVELDLGARPSFWVWNQVLLKDDPGVKVFLESGGRPVLVGWQRGGGRVMCLLVDHRGKSGPDVTAFFDWDRWPGLVRAVFAWLAPNAREDARGTAAVPDAEVRRLVAQLEDAQLDADLSLLEEDDGEDDSLLDDDGQSGGSALSKGALAKRIQTIDRLIAAGSAGTSGVLASQLADVTNLPAATRHAIVAFLSAHPPRGLDAVARRCLASKESAVRSSGCQLLAVAKDRAFARHLTDAAPRMETDPIRRLRDLAIGVTLYGSAELTAEGRRRVAAWNEAERATKMKYTGGRDFSMANPEAPCLDAEALFQRVAWLAYLSRHAPDAFGAQFAREWLMTAQYQEYCDRSGENLWSRNMSAAEVKRARIVGRKWSELRGYFGRLRNMTRADIDRLVVEHPARAIEGFGRLRFTSEFRACMNVLGGLTRDQSARVARGLTRAPNRDLAEFAAARAGE